MVALLLALTACSGASSDGPAPTNGTEDGGDSDTVPAPGADVVAVSSSGSSGAYTIGVTLSSPDTGCEQYADWWELLDEGGGLIYRRILDHSHVDEQPFERTGGPVGVSADATLIVRGHMNTTGYGGAVMRGTVGGGFVVDETVAADFAAGVEGEDPQPSGCAF